MSITKKLRLEDIMKPSNIREAMNSLLTKKDGCGCDGIRISDLENYWEINGETITKEVMQGEYIPGIVKNTEIINYKGKKRSIALYNSVDRLILRAMMQKIQYLYDDIFSEHCYAFRSGYGITEAVSKASQYLEEGYLWTAVVDIKDYFDSIPFQRMEQLVHESIGDERIVELIKMYLHARVLIDGKITTKRKGIIQGSPISPFLSNLYLSRFDCELEERGYRFCRYADDINVFFLTQWEAEIEYAEIIDLLVNHFQLRINESKSGVFDGLRRKYLGYHFVREKENGRVTAVRAQRSRDVCHYRWNKDCIQKIDRNYHIINDGILTKKDFTLLFENENKKQYIPVETTTALNVYSQMLYSSGFFDFMNSKRLNVNLFNRYGNCIGNFHCANGDSSAKTMIRQAALYLDEERRLQIAKKIEIGAAHNIMANVKYYNKSKKSSELKKFLGGLSEAIQKFNEAMTIGELLLIEARVRQNYYQVFNEIITAEEFRFTQRTKRPPKDALNALISFGNTYLYNRIATEIHKSTLDIRIGFLHATNNRYQSLNLDIAEIFKPIIVDRVIFTLINKKMINAKLHFTAVDNGGIYLNGAGKRIYLNALDGKLYQNQTQDGKSVNYLARIRQEVSKISKLVLYDAKYKPYRYY